VKGNGIGSILHVSGFHLAVALEKGRVFMWSEVAGEEWTDPTTCGDKANWECHFQAPSNCSRAHLRAGSSGGGGSAGAANYQEVEMHHSLMGVASPTVPAALSALLRSEAPGMSEAEMKYWWRGQSVAYLMRFNHDTVREVRRMRKDPSLVVVAPDNRTLVAASSSSSSSSSSVRVPFPPGLVHAHVRHGDKYTEMTLQGTARYLAAAQALVITQPTAFRRILFVSTEDEAVLSEAQDAAKDGWSIVHSDIKRSNSGPLAQVLDLGKDRAGYTTRTHLLQLLMSLECDAWIGTRGSNWNRLIDELRCIWVDKCKQPYVEVGTPESWVDYNW
jgi:hypothetical protein